MPTPQQAQIHHLVQQGLVWHGCKSAQQQELLASGHQDLDKALSGGLPATGLILLTAKIGIGELRFFNAYFQQRQQQRLAIFIDPPMDLSGEAISNLGLKLHNCLLLKSKDTKDQLWAIEQCLQSGSCDLVVSWQNNTRNKLNIAQAKRLKLAANQGQSMAIVIDNSSSKPLVLPANLCLHLKASPQGLELSVPKRAQGWPINKLVIDMRKQWPLLCLPERSNNIFTLSNNKQGRRSQG